MNLCKFSPDRRFRYSLFHDLREPMFPEPIKVAAWIGLNPSTADEQKLDNTLRRVRKFTSDFGGNAFRMLNLFAFRATEPDDMKAEDDPTGPENDQALIDGTADAILTLCVWGNDGGHLGRDRVVMDLLQSHDRDLWTLRMTKAGFPEHPLYLPGILKPTRFGPLEV